MTDDQKAARERVEMYADALERVWSATRTATDLRTLLSERNEMEAENEKLRLAICGGEDAPGYAASLPLSDILKVALDNTRAWGEATDRAVRATAERDALAARVAVLEGQGEQVPNPLVFGSGALVVNTGTFGGDNAVFIAAAKWPGPVGEYTGNAAFERDRLQPGELVMIFPTRAQVQSVADTLVGAHPTPEALARAERAEVALSELHDAFRSWKAQTVKQEEAMRNAFAVIAFLSPNPLEWTTSAPSPSPATQPGDGKPVAWRSRVFHPASPKDQREPPAFNCWGPWVLHASEPRHHPDVRHETQPLFTHSTTQPGDGR
jgi:hypothetical protein